MTARRLVILGATVDLTGRYLLAALADMALGLEGRAGYYGQAGAGVD